jgi:hypothetical protein
MCPARSSNGTSIQRTDTGILRCHRSINRSCWSATAATAPRWLRPVCSTSGFTDVADLVGGVRAWIDAGLDVSEPDHSHLDI